MFWIQGLVLALMQDNVGVRSASPGIEAIVFDIGETLVNETRAWTLAAAEVGVSPFTLFGTLGGLIERGLDHRELWTILGVVAPTLPPTVEPDDLYPDALPCLTAMKRAGYRIGVAGNQPAGVEERLRELELPADFVASSAGWGLAKPDRRFFERVCEAAGASPAKVAYVGDRLDNDVLPAKRIGMFAVFLVRGPWGHLHDAHSTAAQADARITSLDQLPAAIPG